MISDISTLSDMTQLYGLYMAGNPFDTDAYCTYVPMVTANNPNLRTFEYDKPNPNPLTDDCSVDMTELSTFASYWLDTGCDESNNFCYGADLNHIDGVDLADLAEITKYWLNGL